MWDEVEHYVALERTDLRNLLAAYADVLNKVASGEAPSFVETSALAAFLNSFYGGIENILRQVADGIDGGSPRGAAWHSELLAQMAGPSPRRRPVLSEALHKELRQFMNFRHVFQHAYSYRLDWERMAPLVLASAQVLDRLETELDEFFLRK